MTKHVIDVRSASTAPPEQLWALVADVERWPAVTAFDDAVVLQPGTDERLGLGSVHEFRAGRVRNRERVVAFDPPRHYAYVVEHGLPLRGYRADVTLTPRADGGTDLHWHSEFSAKIPGTGGLLRRRLRTFIQQTADDLARAASSRSG